MMRNRTLVTAICLAAVGLGGGCQFALSNDRISLEAYPTKQGEEPAWKFGAESPEFKMWAALDAEKTARQTIKGIKGVIGETMTLPGLSLINDLFEVPPAPKPDGG